MILLVAIIIVLSSSCTTLCATPAGFRNFCAHLLILGTMWVLWVYLKGRAH